MLMRTRAVAAWSSAALGVMSLAGCAVGSVDDGYLTLTADESTLAACPPAASAMVESLDTDELPACDPVGQVLVFPDGAQLQLPEQQGGGGAGASSSTRSDAWYSYQSVGNWGLVAARSDPECSAVREWGNPEALRRVHEAFGPDWACR